MRFSMRFPLVCGLTLACALAVPPSARHGWAADMPASTTAPDLTKVRALLKAKNYDAAIVQLRGLIGTQHPDVYNLMGFALRKSGDQAQGMAYYNRALELDPNHKGALEYQGQLFVELGQPDRARANLARLQKLCSSGCEELTDLREAIARAPKPR